MTRPKIVAELKKIIDRHPSRKLLPHAVVKAAADKQSPLHNKFEWDNSRAAAKYRLYQARQLIASVEVFVDDESESSIPAYVSLASDRRGLHGGYRSVRDVFSNAALRREMLVTALGELKAMQFRYDRLTELTGVFSAAKKIGRRHRIAA